MPTERTRKTKGSGLTLHANRTVSRPADPYKDVLQGDTPALTVTLISDIYQGFVCSVCVRLNTPLLLMLRLSPGDRPCWTPIWWPHAPAAYRKITLVHSDLRNKLP